MGLFSNFEKAGPGVSKNEKKKKGLILFFELLTRKFGSYLILNIVYFLTLIPGILAVFFSLLHFLTPLIVKMATEPEMASGVRAILGIISILIAILFSLSPCSSGYYYVLRNYVKEENAWGMSDFWEHFKKNAFKSIVSFLIDTLVVCFSFAAFSLYIFQFSWMGSYIYVLSLCLLFVMILFALSMPFKWMMMVTYDIKLPSLYKNAFLLLLVDAKRNGLYVLSVLFYWFVMYLLSGIVSGFITVIVMGVIGISAYGLVLCMNTYPTMIKYLVKD